jgi:uncharacterized membrane protein
MSEWFWYAIAAAVLYGLHQVFTKLASERIGDGLGGFIVEISAALIIALYLVYLKIQDPIVALNSSFSDKSALEGRLRHCPADQRVIQRRQPIVR